MKIIFKLTAQNVNLDKRNIETFSRKIVVIYFIAWLSLFYVL